MMKTPYDTLLRFREDQETQAQLAVARGLVKMRSAQARLEMLQEAASKDARKASSAERWELEEQMHAAHLRSISKAKAELASVQEELNQLRGRHRDALRQRKIAEHLVQEARQERRVQQSRAEQRALDDLNAARFGQATSL